MLSSDVACADAPTTSVTVSRHNDETLAPSLVTEVCQPDGRIGTVVVVPTSDRDEDLRVRVVTSLRGETCDSASYGAGCIVSRRQLRFIAHEELTVPIAQQVDCAGVACEATTTCRQGTCVEAQVDQDRCEKDRDHCGDEIAPPPVRGGGGEPTCDETQVGAPCTTGLPGVCGAGKLACASNKLTCVGDVAVGAQAEQCNGLDDDCNGQVDDLDVGKDGICDCLRVGVLGTKGGDPSSQSDMTVWLGAQGTSATRIQNTDDTKSQPLDATALGKFDVLIVDRLLREYSTDEAAALQTWVRDKGGGVFAMSGYSDTPNPDFLPNALLAPFGLAYTGSVFLGPITSFATHPVTEGVTSLVFYNGYVVSSSEVAGGSSVPIAFHPNGNVSFAHEQGKGRVVVWGDELISFDEANNPLPTRFWENVLSWIAPGATCQVPRR